MGPSQCLCISLEQHSAITTTSKVVSIELRNRFLCPELSFKLWYKCVTRKACNLFPYITFSGSPKWTSLVLVASSCIACGSPVSALGSVHELTTGSSPENPAHIDLFFQRPIQMTNRLELPENSPSADCDHSCSFCCFCTFDICLSKLDYCGSPPAGTTPCK